MIVFIVVLLVLIIAIMIGFRKFKEDDDWIALIVAGFLGITIMLLVTSIIAIDAPAVVAEQEAKAAVLTEQYSYIQNLQITEDYLLYQGIQDVANSTFLSIREYNTRVARHQSLSDSIWVGIWYNKEWNKLELIEFN